MESLLQHYGLPHEARQTHLRPQDTVPGLLKLPSTGHSSTCTASNPLPAFSYFLKGVVTFFTSLPQFFRFSWIICGGMADGATTKDNCCDLFTPPHTWETDKYQFIGSLNFSHEEKLFQHSDAAKLRCLQPASSTSSAFGWYQEDEPQFWWPP